MILTVRFALLVFYVALLMSSESHADIRNTPLAAEIDAVFDAYNNSNTPGCSVCVIQEGKIVFAQGYGMADLSHGVPLNSQSVFYIASVSKQFVALSTLLAARQGKLSLEDDIRKYLPEMPEYDKPITIRHLIYHTSGLRDYFGLIGLSGSNTASYFSEDYMLELIARQKGLNHPTGEKYSYTNTGYFLLSQIIKRATGETLREFSTKNIFEPLGMKQTFFFDDYTEIVKNRALGHDVKNGKVVRHVSSFDLVGSGGLFTTVEDMFLYDQNFYHNRLENNSSDLLKQFHRAGTLDNGEKLSRNYGFGHYSGEYRGEFYYRHGGSSFGFKADYLQFPKKRFSVVIFCNRSDARPDLLANRVADLFLFNGNKAKQDSKQGNVIKPAVVEKLPFVASSSAVKATLGDYYSEEVRSFLRITQRKDKSLEGRVEFNKPFRMEFNDSYSLYSEGGWKFELKHDDAGKITGFELTTGRTNGLIFVRQP